MTPTGLASERRNILCASSTGRGRKEFGIQSSTYVRLIHNIQALSPGETIALLNERLHMEITHVLQFELYLLRGLLLHSGDFCSPQPLFQRAEGFALLVEDLLAYRIMSQLGCEDKQSFVASNHALLMMLPYTGFKITSVQEQGPEAVLFILGSV